LNAPIWGIQAHFEIGVTAGLGLLKSGGHLPDERATCRSPSVDVMTFGKSYIYAIPSQKINTNLLSILSIKKILQNI
jgi:hypothetical protein